MLGGLLYYFFVLSVASVTDVKLTTIGGAEVDMSECEAETCLIIWMAADCKDCRGFPELIEGLTYLLRRGYGIPTRIVIGGAAPERCRQVAMRYGSDTLVDPARILNVRDEHEFIVFERGGRIIKSSDRPSGKRWQSPVPDQTLRDIAKELGLI